MVFLNQRKYIRSDQHEGRLGTLTSGHKMSLKGQELVTQVCMHQKEVLLCIQGSKQTNKKKLGTFVLDAFFLTGVLPGVFMFVLFSCQEVVRVT